MDRKEAVEVVRKNFPDSRFTRLSETLKILIPELQESEDEQHRKWILEYLYDGMRKSDEQFKNQFECAIAWFEKQKQEQPKVSIWKHWKCGLAGNGEGKQIYLIKDGDAYSLSSCLGFECDYIELSELDNLMFEKQGEQKSKDKYTFNSIPRLLDMIEPTDRAKRYCQKLIDSLQQEGYVTDAKIISEHLKLMNGEEVSMATMDKNQDEKKSVEWSEEDKGFVDLLLAIFTNEHPNGLFTTGDISVFNGKSVSSNRIITWLKSFKPQNTWKPTEEQLSSLKQAISYFGGELPKELQSLYNDLQKLLD